MSTTRRIGKLLLALVAVTAVVAIITRWCQPEQDEMPGDVAFHEVYEDAILAADIYDLSEQELASKYADQQVHVRELPDSQIRYLLMTDDESRVQRISVRGTDNLRNVVVDAEYSKQPDETLNLFLHRGFKNTADEILVDLLPRLNGKFETIITGHSLGGGVAAILMMHLETQGFKVRRTTTFGQPKITNLAGATRFADSKLVRVVNLNDIVTKVPPGSLLANLHAPYRHFAPEVLMLKNNQYVYQRPQIDAEEVVKASEAELTKEANRDLRSDYLDAHRMVNYLARLQTLMADGKRKPGDSVNTTFVADIANSVIAPRRLALLIGIDDYQHTEIPDLKGCVNDVHAMKSLLVGQYGFPASDVRVLTNAAATRDEIIRAIHSNLLRRTGSNDLIVFHFSGRGSRSSHDSGTKDTIVPYNGRTENVNDITIEELQGLFQTLPESVRTRMIFDCCHAIPEGTQAAVIRGLNAQDVQQAQASNSAQTAESKNLLERTNANVSMISASGLNEAAHELQYHKRCNGALTLALVRQAKQSGESPVGLQELMVRVAADVNSMFAHQHPQLSGTHIHEPLFGFDAEQTGRFVKISLHPDGSPVLVAGRAQGMTVGSVFDIYPPTHSITIDNLEPISAVEITETRAFTSEARILGRSTQNNQQPLPWGCRALERVHAYGDFRVTVALADNLSHHNLQERIERYRHLQVIDADADAMIAISLNNGALNVVAPQHGLTKTFPDNADSVTLIEQLVLHWAKWLNLLFLDNPDSELGIEFKIGESTENTTFQAGEVVPLTVRNPNEREIFFVIIDLESNGDVSVLYPNAGQHAKLIKNGTWTGRPKLEPSSSAESRNFLKIIVTEQPIDAHFLEMKTPPELRRSNPLETLLEGAAFGFRSDLSTTVETDTWGTVVRQCRVKSPPESIK